MDKLEVLIDEQTIQNRVEEMAKQISEDYKGKEITVLCVLKGGVFFTVELTLKIEPSVKYEFIQISSYGNQTESSKNIVIKKDLDTSIEGKDVLIVEDIIDSGRTLNFLFTELKQRNPNSLKICTLLSKPERREFEVPVDYIGFEVPNKFVVGHGFDKAEQYRNLPYIATIEEE